MTQNKSQWDCAIIGGGPAGTTVAALIKRYAPQRRVVLIEKCVGPRYHVGEALGNMVLPILRDMGAFQLIDRAGFPKKLGATFIWGGNRKPWSFNFDDRDIAPLLERLDLGSKGVEYAWQMRRSRYDRLLLEHAASLGVEIMEGMEATDIIEESGRIAGIHGLDRSGKRFRLAADFTVDCSGQNGFLSKFRSVRKENPLLKKIAVVAYYRGARWKYRYAGHPDKTRIFICATSAGWFWYIPIEKNVVSVGLVTSADVIKASGAANVQDFYRSSVRQCKEIWSLVKNAQRVKNVENTDKEFLVFKDWSYLCDEAMGPGWLVAGDAAAFTDPVLSVGVGLAHVTGQRAAYTLMTLWKNKDSDGISRHLVADYTAFCREISGVYMALALFWYKSDPQARGWWNVAGKIHSARFYEKLSDKAAFAVAAAGAPIFYDKLFSSPRILEPENSASHRSAAFRFLAGTEVLINRNVRRAIDAETAVPYLNFRYHANVAFISDFERHDLRPAFKIKFLKNKEGDAVLDAVNPRKLASLEHIKLMRLIDGRKTIREIKDELCAKENVSEMWFDSAAKHFLKELFVMGAIGFTYKKVQPRAVERRGDERQAV